MKKILFWSPFIDHVGTTKSTLNSILSIKKFGKNNYKLTVVNVLGEWNKYSKILLDNEISIINLNISRNILFIKKKGFVFSRLLYFKVFFSSFFPLIRILKNEKPDYFYICLITIVPLTVNYLFKFKSKIILRISGYPKLHYVRKIIWNLFLRKVKWIFSPTKITNNFLINSFPNYKNKFKLIRDPIFSYEDILLLKKFKSKKKNFFLSVGRLTKQKNFSFLIKNIYKYNFKNKKKINLFILGNGEEEKNLKNLIEFYKLNKNIKLLGFKHNVKKYMSQARALICTSLWEDPGFIFIEAGICNLPVITNSCPNGPLEIFKDNNNGFMYDFNSNEDFEKKINDFKNSGSDELKKKIFNLKKYSRNYSSARFFSNFQNYVN
jgi:glycosyltransferase involved in cell wall biosynthesis